MIGKRSRKWGFQSIGSVKPSGLGLSRARERELRLSHAWRSVAGDALAAKSTVRVRRRVLEVQAVDLTWLTALEPLMPQIAARLLVRFPDLGMRAWRLQATGVARDCAEHPIDARQCGPQEPLPAARDRAPRAEPPASPSDDADVDAEARLRRVAARYIDRVRTRSEG